MTESERSRRLWELAGRVAATYHLDGVINRIGESVGGIGGLAESEQTRFTDDNESGDPTNDARTLPGGLFNSANRTIREESSDEFFASVSDNPKVGLEFLAEETPVSKKNSAQSKNNRRASKESDADQTSERDQSLSPIKAEISEPF